MSTVLVRNAVAIEDYDSVRKDFDGNPLKVLYLGRIHKEKGVLDLVVAVGLLKKWGWRNITVEIAGSGPALKDVQRTIETCGVSDMVRLVGPVTGHAKMLLWASAHLFVLPSYHEGLPYAVLESLASGTPMITTKVGGIPEVMIEGVHGLFVQPGEPKALAEAVVALITDRAKLGQMSWDCSKHARAKFGAERLSRQFESIYTSVCVCGAGQPAHS